MTMPRAYNDCLQTLVSEPERQYDYWRVKLICGHIVRINYRPRRNRRVFCVKCKERQRPRDEEGGE